MTEYILSGGILEQQFLRLPDLGEHSWRQRIGKVFSEDRQRYADLDRILTEQYETDGVNPRAENLFRAFQACPFEKTTVVICGQDPYPNPEHAMGLSFSVPAGTRLPASLKNIFKELEDDLGAPALVSDGDLTPWAKQGVLLLNTALTVRAGEPNSHKALWDGFARNILADLHAESQAPLVFLLWGNQAKELGEYLQKKVRPPAPRLFLYSAHPSPLSAYRGFFGSKPFSRINEFLQTCGERPIQW